MLVYRDEHHRQGEETGASGETRYWPWGENWLCPRYQLSAWPIVSHCFLENSTIELTMWDPQLEGTIHYESIYSITWSTGRMLGGTPQLQRGA